VYKQKRLINVCFFFWRIHTRRKNWNCT